jgi:hypothetical protein
MCPVNPITQEAEAGGSGVQGQASLGYIKRPCLKKERNNLPCAVHKGPQRSH